MCIWDDTICGHQFLISWFVWWPISSARSTKLTDRVISCSTMTFHSSVKINKIESQSQTASYSFYVLSRLWHVYQDHVCQDHVPQDHVCQDKFMFVSRHVHVLSAGFVTKFCQHVLSTCFVKRFCQHVLSTCFVSRFCKQVLSTSFVNRFCQQVMSTGYVNRFCQLVLSKISNFVDLEQKFHKPGSQR